MTDIERAAQCVNYFLERTADDVGGGIPEKHQKLLQDIIFDALQAKPQQPADVQPSDPMAWKPDGNGGFTSASCPCPLCARPNANG